MRNLILCIIIAMSFNSFCQLHPNSPDDKKRTLKQDSVISIADFYALQSKVKQLDTIIQNYELRRIEAASIYRTASFNYGMSWLAVGLGIVVTTLGLTAEDGKDYVIIGVCFNIAGIAYLISHIHNIHQMRKKLLY